MSNILNDIGEGMDVLDDTGHKIGTVESLKLPEEAPASVNAEPMPAEANLVATPGLVGNPIFIRNLVDVFHADEVPQEQHERLLRDGFIRIDSDGLLASDRYVTPDQIASVRDDKVHLSAAKDDLVKRT